MADFVIHVGSCSAQGRRSNNEDRCVTDEARHVFLVADGMGGQEAGEEASRLAAEIIPQAIVNRLNAEEDATAAVQHALREAHEAIVHAGQHQPSTRKMGTTAVLAVQQKDQVWVAGVGDSPAILIRNQQIEQLTLDHTVADALARNGTITPDQARNSPWRNVLYKFLGCTDPQMNEGAEVRPFVPRAGDRLLLASDGLTNFITHDDLRSGAAEHPDPQEWADHLVKLALDRGSRDNVTCVVVAFDAE
jgi:serine/threonine protein phosphatase PrpC